MLRFAVALCTYDGERFLPEQLRSLAAQTRRPDELAVCDDASSDGTADLVRRFAATAPFPVRLEVNPATLGTAKNFERAIGLASGDLIALADQDDVWHPDKLARLERAFAEGPTCGLAFSDAALVDAAGRACGRTLWRSIGFGPAERRRFAAGGAFACLLRRRRVTGAAVAFRARYRDLVLPVPAGWMHDAWIALLIAAVAECRPVEEALLDYRQHAGQQIGGRRPGLLGRLRLARAMGRGAFEAVADRHAEARDRLRGRPDVFPDHLSRLEAQIAHWQRRAEMRAGRGPRWPAVLRDALRGDYARYSHGWKSAAQDLFL